MTNTNTNTNTDAGRNGNTDVPAGGTAPSPGIAVVRAAVDADLDAITEYAVTASAHLDSLPPQAWAVICGYHV